MADPVVTTRLPGATSDPTPRAIHRASLVALVLGALGVVFGDIGTSPLYTLKECLHAAGGLNASRADVFGILSLMVWSLIMVVTVKYIIFVMRAEHHGEGGIFALLALIPEKLRVNQVDAGKATVIAVLAVTGAALLYGDGVITPAISVLSAMEGLTIANESLRPLVLPLTCLILIGLFAIQKRGTGAVGALFGPIMLVWFGTLALLGAWHITERPEVLFAFSPLHGLDFFGRHGLHGIHILGSVVLAVTGAEALYADMGHFGAKPIRLAWFYLVFPSLVLSYLGQGALVLANPHAAENPFFSQVPAGHLTLALVVLSSFATVIASQALISGAFSLTRQAMALGYFPQVTIRHTAHHTEGQIYIPEINALLGAGCLLLVITFRESVRLAAAYGIAVTGTMAITSILYYIVAKYTWHWPAWKAGAVLALFLAIDIPFLAANLFKFTDGGYVPVLIGALLIAAMLIWMRGRTYLEEQHLNCYPTYDDARREIERSLMARVPGTAVFFSPTSDHVPPMLVRYVHGSKCLQKNVVLLSVKTETIPTLPDADRYELSQLGPDVWRLVIHYGYMEIPNIMPVLKGIARRGELPLDIDETTFFVGHETTLNTNAGKMGRIAESIFGYLQRNAVKAEHAFGMPPAKVIELGARVDL